MPIDFNQIRELLAAVAQTEITELTLKCDEFELSVRKGATSTASIVPSAAPVVAPAPLGVPALVPDVVAPTPETNKPDTSKWSDVVSPMVGTFYRAPAPGEAPFVDVGDRIGSEQTVCIIEAMKLMNEIEAEVSGEVMEILVENGEPVEYGQVLMRVKPA
ncbi:acetyl-CoA carboxylase, biotin carboxyl carrier protein [Rubidibacter lacunae KORDI 51-2]|uniref:Biotin carboxyl carrier protein of acetyl-CoA carboxylase n=1 Tax=Rubidibacter lacunae KORDI 51-2 TaxID=582515 RepID=U5DFW4_9CHRO|nr:acetyl-CoA carboxylase biotin carboxyl carrier protein [Rubidibacter lacunae]ERN40491.1 acetyl-CoA carboxylase, biotin carboxyl carrier protein [Rubidibacter lacunae KORDI 51-2]